MDLDVSMRVANYPYTVHFYGALFREVGIVHLKNAVPSQITDSRHIHAGGSPDRYCTHNLLGKFFRKTVVGD